MFRKCILFPSSGGVDIKIFLTWWTSGWKYCGLTVSFFSPWEQPYLKAQMMKELFLSSPPEDGNTNRIRKFVAFVNRNKGKPELQMRDLSLSAEKNIPCFSPISCYKSCPLWVFYNSSQ